ncbi:MAG: nucleotidyl transferase AbiEii/AbiGii toxin family protein [Candidatus Omnitrophica bacterium]|nr:nucleotidyl transferase AbiEii/AbiGii toxin family protein [Candidatus Omnitrophota bacterium]
MIEIFKDYIKDDMPYAMKLNVVRERLQIMCLKIMSDEGLFTKAAFLGGTALRIIYGLRRFSEDLDFSLREGASISVDATRQVLVASLKRYGLMAEARERSVGAVKSIFLKFPGLLKDVGLSRLAGHKVVIKWDIDTNPPAGARVVNTIIEKGMLITIAQYDLPSLFAGKLHACLFRTYVKGRDWYDLIWHLNRGTEPNYILLNNAIEQTHAGHGPVDGATIGGCIKDRINALDLKKAAADVERFLEDPKEVRVFDHEALCALVDRVSAMHWGRGASG